MGTHSVQIKDFLECLHGWASDMEAHEWITEAADLRKWALELRADLANQSYSLEQTIPTEKYGNYLHE